MKKYTKNDLLNLISIKNDLSKYYTFDLYIFKYKPVNGTKSNNHYIQNTITLYMKYHPDFDNSKIFLTIDDLEKISKYDTLISIDNQIILKELYAILYFIHQTQTNIKTIENTMYPKKYFANYHFDKREVKREYFRFNKIIRKSKTPLSNKKEILFLQKLLALYLKDKIIFEFVLNELVLSDIEKLSNRYNVDTVTLKIIFDKIYFMTTQKTTKNAIIKSLGIILYFKLKNYLHINISDSESYASNIIENLYNTSFNSGDIKYKIYIKSLINATPVFGAKRKSHYTLQNQMKIKKILIEQLSTTTTKEKIQELDFTSLIRDFIDKPHLKYIQKYPIELFEINPKYSN